MRTTFEVGNHEKHTIGVYWSVWSLEVYTVDGVEVLRQRSRAIRGSRKFSVGEQEKHEVEIVIDMAPGWKSWLFPTDWRAQAFVDGALVVEDLTPGMRKTVKSLDRVFNYVLVITGVVLLILFVLGRLG